MKKLIAFVCIVHGIFSFGQTQSTPDTLKYCLRKDRVGAGGYDVVSYFKSEKPSTGTQNFEVVHDGVIYRFANEANKKKFQKNPTIYLPQFGGWCSMTLAMGRATTPTYDNFAIISGKLYLFERTLSVNGRELWLHNAAGNEKTATANYQNYKATGKIQ